MDYSLIKCNEFRGASFILLKLKPACVCVCVHVISGMFINVQGKTDAVVDEIEGSAHLMDPDPLASARSKRKFALDTRYTPDGLKVLQSCRI